jgi:hypothetical protein
MKYVRVYTNSNEQIILESFSEGIQLADVQAFPIPERFTGLVPTIKQMCNLDYSEHTGSCCDFPATNHIDKWYLDGNGNIQVDTSWDMKLMPKQLIHSKNIVLKNSIIDSELDNETPDLLKIIRASRSIDKVKSEARAGSVETKYIYEQALANLDARVANGEPDKAVIRQKLEAKIASFE